MHGHADLRCARGETARRRAGGRGISRRVESMSAADAMRTIAAVRVVKPGVLLRKWSDGTQALVDLARALSATGRDDTRAFLEWRMPHGLSLTKAAEALGL